MRLALAVLSLLASASGLVLSPAGLQSRAPAAVAAPLRARAPPSMSEVVRVEIEVEQGEPIEKALRRFRKASNMSGHLRLLRNRKTFESAHDKAIRKKKEAMMRRARARRSSRARNF